MTRRKIKKLHGPSMGKGFWSDTLLSFMIGATGFSPQFRKPENFRKGKINVFRPMRGSGFSRYQIMVKSLGVMLKKDLVPRPTQEVTESTHSVKYWCPPCLSFACCMLYFFHSSLVIGMLFRLVRLKNVGWAPRV